MEFYLLRPDPWFCRETCYQLRRVGYAPELRRRDGIKAIEPQARLYVLSIAFLDETNVEESDRDLDFREQL